MVRFQNPPRSYGGGGMLPPNSRFNDVASYATDTSSITNPVELGFSYSDEDDGGDAVSFIDSATSALTGLTGWTSANGNGPTGGAASRVGGMSAISELGESENFPLAHSKSYKSQGAESVVSGLASERISAISFDLNGSVETSLDEIEVPIDVPHSSSYKKAHHAAKRGAKGVQYGSSSAPPVSPSSSIVSNNSNNSKKRAPVPPLRDPNMEDKEEDQMWEEDCNYDINPTLMFLVLESRDWTESVSLLDGKGLVNKNGAWNLGSLFGNKRKGQEEALELTKKRQKELRAQARTWIIRRERNGVLRWRMLPLHAALAFNAPFEVVLRLYHLYPGAVRCRNDQGMLPLHHVFKYGNEDRVLELLLDVFPDALTVLDDKGRLPLACTPQDGSDNERRSSILTLFSNFQVELATKKKESDASAAADEPKTGTPAKDVVAPAHPKPQASAPLPRVPLSPIVTGQAEEEENEGTLGAAPRYTANADYAPGTFNSIKPLSAKKEQQNVPKTPLSPKGDDDGKADRYAMLDGEDGENININGKMGLSTIPEEDDIGRNMLKSELLALGEKKRRRGLKKGLAHISHLWRASH